MITDDFFTKCLFAVTKRSGQVVVTPDEDFVIPINIFDIATQAIPDSITGTLVATSGRNTTVLSTIVTITKISTHAYQVSGKVLSTLWNGSDSLVAILDLVANGTTHTLRLPISSTL